MAGVHVTMKSREVSMDRVRVGDLTIDPRAGSVVGPDGRIELFPQTFRLLTELAGAAPEACRTVDLIDAIWPDGFVGDQNLKQRVYQLRRAVGDFGVEIATVRGVGYRLATAVEPVEVALTTEAERDPAAVADYKRAIEFIDEMAHGKALALLLNVVAMEPDWVAARSSLVWAHMWAGNPKKARAALDEALEMSSDVSHPDHMVLRGMRASFAGDAVEAISRFELALERNPGGYWLHINLMGLYWLVGRRDAAAALLDRVEELRPGFYLNAWQRGFHALLADGNLAAAREDFAEVARLNPNLPLPLADVIPILEVWAQGNRGFALEMIDGVIAERIGGLPPLGADQLLTFRSRLLADLGDVEGARDDQQRAAGLFGPEDSWSLHHALESGLLAGVAPGQPGVLGLERVAAGGSALLAAQAHGWLGVAAAIAGDIERAGGHRVSLGELEYEEGWEWGYPTRPAFDRARSVFGLLISGHLALGNGELPKADRQFARALRTTPVRWQVVPVISLDGRASLAAREGIALVAAAQGDLSRATEANRWLVEHPLETVMLSQAGVEFRQRAEERLN